MNRCPVLQNLTRNGLEVSLRIIDQTTPVINRKAEMPREYQHHTAGNTTHIPYENLSTTVPNVATSIPGNTNINDGSGMMNDRLVPEVFSQCSPMQNSPTLNALNTVPSSPITINNNAAYHAHLMQYNLNGYDNVPISNIQNAFMGNRISYSGTPPAQSSHTIPFNLFNNYSVPTFATGVQGNNQIHSLSVPACTAVSTLQQSTFHSYPPEEKLDSLFINTGSYNDILSSDTNNFAYFAAPPQANITHNTPDSDCTSAAIRHGSYSCSPSHTTPKYGSPFTEDEPMSVINVARDINPIGDTAYFSPFLLFENDLEFPETKLEDEVAHNNLQKDGPFPLCTGLGLATATSNVAYEVPADEDGETELHIAIKARNTPKALELITQCCLEEQEWCWRYLNKMNKRQQAAIHLSCRWRSYHVLKALLKQGVNINLQDNKGNTVLHIILLSEVDEEHVLDLVECFFEKHVRNLYTEKDYATLFNTTNYEGKGAIHIAGRKNLQSIIQRMADHGANLNLKDSQDLETCLVKAAKIQNWNQVKFLAGLRACVNIAPGSKVGAIHLACMQDNIEAVQFLIENGAVLNKATSQGKRLKDLTGSKEIKELLEKEMRKKRRERSSRKKNSLKAKRTINKCACGSGETVECVDDE